MIYAMRSIFSLAGCAFLSVGVPVSLTGAEPAPKEAEAGKATAALAEKLVIVEDGETKAYTPEGEPEFYIIYHSASW